MPDIYIKKHAPITLREPTSKRPLIDSDTGKQLRDETIELFIARLLNHPLFDDGWRNIKAGIAINEAINRDHDKAYIRLSEDDYDMLKQAAEAPKQKVMTQMGPQAIPGLGLPTYCNFQLGPHFESIMEPLKKEPEDYATALSPGKPTLKAVEDAVAQN